MILVVVVVVGGLMAGCGGDNPDISDAAAADLQPRAAEIRNLAGQRHADQVAAKLAEMRSLVDDLVQRGELSDRAAREILAAAGEVQGQLVLITTTTTAPLPRPSEDGHHEDEDDDEDEDEEEREEEDD